MVAHPGTLDKETDYVLWPAQQWVARGAVCVTIDQAGHGERARRPVTMDDFPALAHAPHGPVAADRRRLAAHAGLGGFRTTRWMPIGSDSSGFSMGGMRGAPFVGIDERVRAASFCISASTTLGRGETADLASQLTDPGVYPQ